MERAAELSSRPLGALIAISSGSNSGPFYPRPYFGEDGTFGPGKHCGTVRRPITRRDGAGRRKVVGTRTSRQCRVPQYVVASVTLVYGTARA